LSDPHCPKHFPRRYSKCKCSIPSPPAMPTPTDTCRWCFAQFGDTSCQRFGHLKMALAEHDAALKFYARTYGVKVEKPPEPLSPLEVTPEMRLYFASLGRRGGASKSPRKQAASRANLLRGRNVTFGQG
jgi:hypothetical protein